jgi:cellulose synthase/poly-beta-1,6-N-acetylglucosamine synthase-like glycosyltransferase
VIPAYNEADCIGDCLRSILREIRSSGCSAEIIVVNNASTDETARVAAGFPGVTVVDEPRAGVNRARQAGFLHARGDIVACVDADTTLTRGWIRTVIRAFARRERVVCVTGPCVYRDVSPFVRIATVAWYVVAFVGFGLLGQFVLRRSSLVQGGNHAVRRSALERVGGYNTQIDFHGDDMDTSRRLAKAGVVLFTFRLPAYTSARRLRREGVLRTAWKYALNGFSVSLYGRAFSRSHTDVRG